MSVLEKKNDHIGRKISRIREIRGMKQEALAAELGISQQSVSTIEQSETLEEERLEKVASALGVTKDAIENFSEEKAINYFNTFSENDFSNSQGVNVGSFGANCTFNPVDKLIEAIEENKKLYERLLTAEKEKLQYVEGLLRNKESR